MKRRGGIAAISNKISMNGDIVYHHYPSLSHPTLSIYKDIHSIAGMKKKGKERCGN
jgi:hypothetical protein